MRPAGEAGTPQSEGGACLCHMRWGSEGCKTLGRTPKDPGLECVPPSL